GNISYFTNQQKNNNARTTIMKLLAYHAKTFNPHQLQNLNIFKHMLLGGITRHSPVMPLCHINTTSKQV
ncbi:MAG: hypothetical protein PUI23_02085, partial [Bacteroidales bacterium]|nr:hypothetical protein [Bacteroidales bacterium]MDY5225596.1 hypothetical protein [Sodaliphilus sp.]